MRPTDPAVGPPGEWWLRPAEEADLTELAEVQRRAREAAPMPGAPAVDELLVDLSEGLRRDDLWVAETGAGEEAYVLGYVRFVRPGGGRVGWLDDLYVLPEAAGHGVGTALLDLVRASLTDGFGLWVFASNTPARAFYATRGLHEVEHVAAAESPHRRAEVRLTSSPPTPVVGLA